MSELQPYNCKLQSLSKNTVLDSVRMFKDPVCNMMVDEKKTKFVSESGDGRKVYLCSAACKSQFEGNPAKYGY
jgi:YHS domain-containing protein